MRGGHELVDICAAAGLCEPRVLELWETRIEDAALLTDLPHVTLSLRTVPPRPGRPLIR